MNIISRAEWGARPPRHRDFVPWSQRTGVMGHYSAASPTQTPRQIQDFHMDVRGWSDVGYNFLIDSLDGDIFEGRGWGVLGAHCAGHNTANIGICIIGKDRAGIKDVSDAARRSFRWLYEQACDRKGTKLTLIGHRDRAATSCPGDEIHSWLRAGMPIIGQTPPPAPTPGRPAPGPALTFPLPAGWYFGPASGPDYSVSGRYERWFKGRTDRAWLREWATQLSRRGWSVGKGRRWLTEHGNDGQYGPEYATLARAFQSDQRLHVDGLIGVRTWNAAFRNPVT